MASNSPFSGVLARVLAAAVIGLATSSLAAYVDADAAQALANKSDCFKCHSIDKKKDAPSFKEAAGRFKGKAGAEDEIYRHLTSAPTVKIDCKEEEHKMVKSKDDAELRNLARWILSH